MAIAMAAAAAACPAGAGAAAAVLSRRKHQRRQCRAAAASRAAPQGGRRWADKPYIQYKTILDTHVTNNRDTTIIWRRGSCGCSIAAVTDCGAGSASRLLSLRGMLTAASALGCRILRQRLRARCYVVPYNMLNGCRRGCRPRVQANIMCIALHVTHLHQQMSGRKCKTGPARAWRPAAAEPFGLSPILLSKL